MNIWSMIAAFVLLSNPNIGIIDFLPDFIGLILLIRGIGLAKLYTDYWKKACRTAVVLTGVNVVKCACTAFLFNNIRALPIVLSFSFAIVEGVLLLLLAHDFFEGLFYLGVRYDIKSVFTRSKKSEGGEGKTSTEPGVKLKRSTFVFFVFRSVISILPDISDLHIASDKESVFSFSDLRSLFSATVLIVGVIAAILYLVKLIPYLNSIRRDPGTAQIRVLCTKLYEDPAVRSTLRMRRSLFILSAIIVASLFISIDGVILPSFVAAILTVFYAFAFIGFDKKAALLTVPALIGGIFSYFNALSRHKFFIAMSNDPEASLWSPASADVYSSVKLYTMIERLLLAVSLLGLILLLYFRIRNEFRNKASEIDSFSREKSNVLIKRLRVLMILGVPVYSATAFEPFLAIEIDFISVLLTVVNIVWIVTALLLIYDLIYQKYPLSIDEE